MIPIGFQVYYSLIQEYWAALCDEMDVRSAPLMIKSRQEPKKASTCALWETSPPLSVLPRSLLDWSLRTGLRALRN